jgi:dinuclear metal center YbgI/SA1388 family protein
MDNGLLNPKSSLSLFSMKIAEIVKHLETIAPPYLQESYDNAGLLTGNMSWECTGALISLDVTEDIVKEAIDRNCNLIVAHHPIIFGGLKKITGRNYVEKTVIMAIKNDIAIYAIHTNLDNVLKGVSGKMADMLGLTDQKILQPKTGILKKLVTFVPIKDAEKVRAAIFAAGGGHLGNYEEASFGVQGTGTFKAGEGTNPHVGKIGVRHEEAELKLEIIFPAWIEGALIAAMIDAHPYEEVAYDIISLDNAHGQIGSGIIGKLKEPMAETAFFSLVKQVFGLSVIRHTPFTGKMVKKLALCGGAGSFLINTAAASGADVYLTGDIKYHEFFEANGRLVVADIGHYESEQYTIDLLFDVLSEKFSNFAVLKTGVKTNPVHYFR